MLKITRDGATEAARKGEKFGMEKVITMACFANEIRISDLLPGGEKLTEVAIHAAVAIGLPKPTEMVREFATAISRAAAKHGRSGQVFLVAEVGMNWIEVAEVNRNDGSVDREVSMVALTVMAWNGKKHVTHAAYLLPFEEYTLAESVESAEAAGEEVQS